MAPRKRKQKQKPDDAKGSRAGRERRRSKSARSAAAHGDANHSGIGGGEVDRDGDLRDTPGAAPRGPAAGEANRGGEPRWFRRDRPLWGAVLFFLVLGLYLPSVYNDFVYDDFVLIVDADSPTSFSDVVRVFGERHWSNLPYYRPIPRATMVLQNLWYGHQPGPYHALNAILAAVAAVLAYALLRAPGFGIVPPFALLGAALFAAHPIASATVYPICSGRETLLPTIFTLASVAAFLRAGWGWYATAVVTLVFALLSKEQAIILPALFVLADLTGVSQAPPGRKISRWVARYAPIVLLVAAYILIREALFGGGNEHRFVLGREPWGPLLSLGYALQTLFVPFVQLVYEPRPEVWVSPWRLVVAGVLTLALVWGTLRLPRSARGTALFWTGWFFISLAPTANVLHQETGFAERYSFVALLGVIALGGVILSAEKPDRPLRRWAPVFCLVWLVGLAAISVHRGSYFRTNLGFLHHWAETDAGAVQPQASLGEHYGRAKQFDLSVEHHRKALALRPNLPKRLNSLADALRLAGQIDEAMAMYEAAIRGQPSLVHARINYGVLLRRRRRTAEAMAQYAEVIKYDPGHYLAYYNLGNAHFSRGELEQAVESYTQALRVKPQSAEASGAMAAALTRLGRTQEAFKAYERALALDPRSVFAQYNLGALLLAQGDNEAAARAFRRTLQLDPNHASARKDLQEATQRLGRGS